MITKDNISVYAELFAEANKCLQDISINDTIDSIEEYFKHLHDLVYTQKDSTGKYNKVSDPNFIGEDSFKFLRLPLDEPMFEINANTREIQVPRDNWTHGVKGDEIAEVLFFRINRYYDATDLAQMNIAIEWNNGTETGSTESFIKYVEEDSKDKDLKIIFGWPLDGKITANASTVRFSIHFYQVSENPGEYIYSFHTLPQEIHIKDTLKIDYDKVKVESFKNKILTRVSSSSGDKLSSATIPYFILPESLNTEIDDIVSGGYTMRAVAGRERGEATSYKWYQGVPGDISNSKALTENYALADEYYPIDKFLTKAVNENTVSITTYFYDSGDKKEAIGCYNQEDFANALKEKGTLYVAVSKYELDSGKTAGQYWVEAYNRYGLTNKVSLDDKNNNVPVWIITSPLVPVIDALPDAFTTDGLTTSLSATVSNVQDDGVYTWYYYSDKGQEKGSISDNKTIIPLKEGYYYLTITNSRNNSQETTISNDILVVEEYKPDTFNNKWTLEFIGAVSGIAQVRCPADYNYKTFETIKCEWFESETKEIGNNEIKKTINYQFNEKEPKIMPEFQYTVDRNNIPNYLIARMTFSKGNVNSFILTKVIDPNTGAQEG